MKKPQFKLLKEFKTFISKGNALDLAVGMIIGSAFTAIITALVNGILKPIINCIISLCVGDKGLESAVTFLSKKMLEDGSGIDMVNSIYIDWGTLISAIITFLLTAIVLFAIIKAINTAKSFGSKEAAKLAKQVKKGKISEEEAAKKQAELDAQQAPAAPAVPVETTDDLLREIRDLLKAQQLKNVSLDGVTVEQEEKVEG